MSEAFGTGEFDDDTALSPAQVTALQAQIDQREAAANEALNGWVDLARRNYLPGGRTGAINGMATDIAASDPPLDPHAAAVVVAAAAVRLAGLDQARDDLRRHLDNLPHRQPWDTRTLLERVLADLDHATGGK